MTASRKGSWSDGGTTDGELLAGTADRLRWRAPELTLVFARLAATRAGEAKDRALALRANALVVAALVRLGKHAEAVEPAVSALREAETAGERELAGEVRVDLAASTRAVGLSGSAFVLVRPMLEGSDTRPAVRAGALAEIVGGLAQAGRLEVIDEVLSEADRLYAADDMLTGDVRRVLRALLCARIASFRRRWGNPTGAVAAATEGMTLLDGLTDPGTDSGQARAELGLEMVSALLDAGEETAALGQADQTLTQPVRASSAAAIGRLMLILATRVHFPSGRTKQAHALLAEIVRISRRHELDGLLADVLTSLAYAQEADGDLTEALNSLRSARAAEQRRLRADTLARLIVLEELGAGTRLPDDTESLLRRVVRTPARSLPEAPGTEVSSREAASREMSGAQLAGRDIGPGPRPRPTRGSGTYDSVGYERGSRGTEGYDLAASTSQDYDTAAAGHSTGDRYALTAGASQDYGLGYEGSQGYDLEGYPIVSGAGYSPTGTRGAGTTGGRGTSGTGGLGTGGGSGTGSRAGGGGGEGGGGGAPGTPDLAASALAGTSNQDILGRELAGWEMVARERAMDLAGQTRAGSDLVAADRAAPEWAGADPAAVDRVVGRAAVDRAAVDLAAADAPADVAARSAAHATADATAEAESDWSAIAERQSRPKGRRAADADKPKWPDPSQNERDEETGLLNRQGLRRRLAAARRQARPTALTLVRLEPSGEADPEPEERRKDPDSTDRFSAALIKAIDTAGRIPPEIDPDVLTSLADHVRDMAPEDAELARPDDGELAVLLPDTTRDEAEQFAATLRETVSASDWNPQDPARGVSVSTGVAQYQEGTSEDALLSAAREALTSTEHDTDRPDWQSVEPVYDLPPEDSGYTYIKEYADLSSDGPDPEMAEYLAGFPLPDYGRQWPSVEQPEIPGYDPADTDEAGRSVLDRLDITRGSGGRRRAPDAYNADQSTDFEQYAIKQPMESYSNTGDEILAAAEEAERASIPRTPEPEEIPAPPDGPEVPIPPDPDVEPQPGRRRRPLDPDDPDADPVTNPRPRFPAGPDIPVPQDPDADPDPRRRRWTSESDPENPRARRRALPRDPSRRAVEPDDDPEPAGPLEEPHFSSRMDPPKRPSDVGQSTGRRRMPDPPAGQETAAGRRRAPEPFDEAPPTASGRRRMPEPENEPEPPGRRSAPGESTGRRRMPDALSDPESTGRRRMPEIADDPESTGRRRIADALSDPESTGRRRMPDALSDPGLAERQPLAEVVDDPDSTGRRRVADALNDPETTGRRRMPEALRDPESTGRRRMPEIADDPEPTGRRRVEHALTDPESTGRRRVQEALTDPEPTGRRRMPDLTDDPESSGRRRVADLLSGLESLGRRRMPDVADDPEPTGRRGIPGDSESAGRRRTPDVKAEAERRQPESLPGSASSEAFPAAAESAGRRHKPEAGRVSGAEPSGRADPLPANESAERRLSLDEMLQAGGIPAGSEQSIVRRLSEPLAADDIQAEPSAGRAISESLGLDEPVDRVPERSPGEATVRHPMPALPAAEPGQETVRRAIPETPADLDDFPSAARRQPEPEVFSLGPDGLSRRPATPGTASAEPVEETIQPAALDELAKRRQAERTERQERLRRRVEQSGEATGDRPSRLRRRERTDLKLADLLAEALVAYQSSTAEAPGEDVLSAYEDLDAAPGDDPERHRGGTGY